MRRFVHPHPTIGFLSTWAVYEGATIDHYTHSLLQGMYAAARERGCNLLLGCGVSLPDSPRASRTAWAVEGAGADFVPVSPENCDGLIIIPDDFSPTQFAYVQELIRSGFPVIFTTNEEPGPLVAVDNAGGIQQAMQHLFQHGHRRIAYVAGKAGRGGDSGERLAAYRQALAEAGIAADERLIAFGEHRRQDGRRAMQQILDGGAAFTALLASNDLSCLGALDALRVTGRRVPEDVAVIGFDDILEARSHLPALTTVRIPTFTLGHTAVTTLLDVMQGQIDGAVALRVPTQFVIRQSCGCHPASQPLNWVNQEQSVRAGHAAHSNGDKHDLETAQENLARAIGDAVFVETRHSLRAEIDAQCLKLVSAFGESIARNDTAPMDAALQALFDWLERQGEEAHPWQSAISTVRSGLAPLMACLARANSAFADALLDQARLQISEQGQRQANSALLQHIELSNRLGLMTAQLLAAPDATASANILAEHLPRLGIERALVAAYSKSADASGEHAAASHYVIGLSVGWGLEVGQTFPSGAFPPPDENLTVAPLQLALLPLTVDADTHGFVAFSANNLEPLAAITHNLASALRTTRLYHAALEGRRLAEDANRLKSRFLSTVSHELRTPLALIVGLSDMVLQDQSGYAEALPSPMRHDLKQIQVSAQHLGRLINDVLDLASSDAGQLRLLRQPLDLVDVLKESASVGAELAREKGLMWRAEIPAQLPHVMGDRTRLRQVILNLISNAVKFTPAGMVELSAAVDGAQICVQVSDTGIGIPAAEQGKIFDEFHRTAHTIQAGYGGLGLGLAISKELVSQHGGMLKVRSPGNLGQGATFFFTLPIQTAENARGSSGSAAKERRGVTATDTERWNALTQPPAPETVKAARERTAESRQRTVLVVDDDPNILALHCRLIEQAGHRAVQAQNGREALAMIQAARPDLVVLDLMMPEVDGFQVIEALRADESLRDLPVIVLSARHLDETDIEHLNHGVAAIMGKGLFSAGETLEHIQAALERQRGLGSPTRQLVRRAMGFIHANYAEPLTREQIAGHINIHPDYLTDCFRQEVGITPMAYLNRYRIRQARELLENSDLKITAIAQAVGLGESAHFTRIFQREVGMTPRAYRKSKGRG